MAVHIQQVATPAVQRKVCTDNFNLAERFYSACVGSPIHAHVKNYIIITLGGRYQSSFDGGVEEFTPWTVAFHRAGVSHTSQYSAQGAHVLYVEFPWDRVSHVCRIPPSHLRHFSLQGGEVEGAARRLYGEFSTPDDYSAPMIDSLVTQLLVNVMRRQQESPQRLPVWLGRANELIRERFTEPITVAEIARSVHVHPGHLSREYARFYNCSVSEQIRRLRVEHACAELSATEKSLADIALAAGFSDQSHFSVSFKQQMGTTPLHYRKSVKTMLES